MFVRRAFLVFSFAVNVMLSYLFLCLELSVASELRGHLTAHAVGPIPVHPASDASTTHNPWLLSTRCDLVLISVLG